MLTEAVRANMAALLAKAEAGIAGLPPRDWKNPAPFDAAVGKLVRELEAAGARINDRPSWETAVVKACGIRATCTNGTAGALRNWCVAARKRLQEAA